VHLCIRFYCQIFAFKVGFYLTLVGVLSDSILCVLLDIVGNIAIVLLVEISLFYTYVTTRFQLEIHDFRLVGGAD